MAWWILPRRIANELYKSDNGTGTAPPLTGSLMDYALPRAVNVPAFDLETQETPSPVTPLGVKGIGELPTLAAPVAIANAVMDALSHLGIRHIDTPLTPEKIWMALQEAKG